MLQENSLNNNNISNISNDYSELINHYILKDERKEIRNYNFSFFPSINSLDDEEEDVGDAYSEKEKILSNIKNNKVILLPKEAFFGNIDFTKDFFNKFLSYTSKENGESLLNNTSNSMSINLKIRQ